MSTTTQVLSDIPISRNQDKPKGLYSNQISKEESEFVLAILKKEERWHGEVFNKRKSGENYYEWLTITAVKDNAGQIPVLTIEGKHDQVK